MTAEDEKLVVGTQLITTFVKERDDALRSLDLEKINAYMRKYGSPELPDNEIGWRAVHKARTASLGISEADKQISRRWLQMHNSEAWG